MPLKRSRPSTLRQALAAPSALRLPLALLITAALALAGAGSALALTPASEPVAHQDCNPCVTVIDQPAYDEQVTVVDQPAYDEQVTVVDVPASSATSTVIDRPATSVAHHDLVAAAYTVARQVLESPGHYQVQPALVRGHYERGPDELVRQGYDQSVWITSSAYQQVFVSSGYWGSQWVQNGYWTQSWVSSGYYGERWQPAYYVPFHCWGGPDGDCDGDFWVPGYSYSAWIDTSSYQSVWIDTSYWNSVWVDTSHYEGQWVDTSHWGQQWVDTSYTQPTALWVADAYVGTSTFVPAGYVQPAGCGYSRVDEEDYCWSASWVATAYWATPTQVWVDPVYTTVSDLVPAVYRDWTEPIPALTHQESYTVPAVTHQATVHHDALTHVSTVHHDALTHQAQAAVALSQSSQGAPPADAGPAGGGTTTTSTVPTVSIPVVSTITLVDRPATTRTVTVVDRPAYDEQQTVVTQAASDEIVQTAVYRWDCEDRCVRTLDHYDSSTLHHDAVTSVVTIHHDAVSHDETVPAVAPQDSVRSDTIVSATRGDSGATNGGSDDSALGVAGLLGLVALAGAGRYASGSEGDPPPPTPPDPWGPGGPLDESTRAARRRAPDAESGSVGALGPTGPAGPGDSNSDGSGNSNNGDGPPPPDTQASRAARDALYKSIDANQAAVDAFLAGEGITPGPPTPPSAGQPLPDPDYIKASAGLSAGGIGIGASLARNQHNGNLYLGVDGTAGFSPVVSGGVVGGYLPGGTTSPAASVDSLLNKATQNVTLGFGAGGGITCSIPNYAPCAAEVGVVSPQAQVSTGYAVPVTVEQLAFAVNPGLGLLVWAGEQLVQKVSGSGSGQDTGPAATTNPGGADQTGGGGSGSPQDAGSGPTIDPGVTEQTGGGGTGDSGSAGSGGGDGGFDWTVSGGGGDQEVAA